MKLNLLLLFCLTTILSTGQITKKPVNVLFIGNSYTYVNNLPQILVGVAASTGEVIRYDNYTPGGYSLEQHYHDSAAIRKIRKGGYDYAVLQEQSQRPSGPEKEVKEKVFPYAQLLDSLIHRYNPKAKTIFYMTWGRKNGDTARCKTWAPVCTYAGMDSLTALRYTQLAEMNHASLAPVGKVWNYLRKNYPSMELYWPDESHPTEFGSYAGACCFYSVIFGKPATSIIFDYTLSKTDASKIRDAVDKIQKK